MRNMAQATARARRLMALLCLWAAQCTCAADPPRIAALTAAMERPRPLHPPIDKPGPSDWLAQHREAGQTFRESVEDA